jgi:hypothetical protein
VSIQNDTCSQFSTGVWPPRHVGRLLIDVFLTNIYNAHLLFHRQTLLEDYDSSKVPDHVCMSIFSLASLYVVSAMISLVSRSYQGLIFIRFFREWSPLVDSVDGTPFEGSSLHTFGRSWAEKASQMVLVEADHPNLDTIRTCENLSYFWFSLGETHRAAMHSSTHILVSPMD